MPYTITAFLTRKSGLTPSEFRTYYDTIHIPLLLKTVGSSFPKTHTRHYITRTPINPASNDKSNDNFKATVFAGTQEDFGYDVYAETVFETEEKMMEFLGKLKEADENPDGIWRADQEKFLNMEKSFREKGVLVEDSVVTRGLE